MKEQELKEHIRRAKVAQWYVLTMLIGVCLAIFFYVRSVVLEESEDEIPLVQQEKGIAVAIVYSSFEVRGGKDMDEVYGFGGAGVFSQYITILRIRKLTEWLIFRKQTLLFVPLIIVGSCRKAE